MSSKAWERHQPPRKPSNSANEGTQKRKKLPPPSGKSSAGSRNNRDNRNYQNRGNGENNQPPSPWLDETPFYHPNASFVEYLRWMREPNRQPNNKGKDPSDPNTKTQILQLATEQANYNNRLDILNKRLELIAKNTFEVKCAWRIRVGGDRGPEDILLPAFDALGIPYIPSSTLRGIARTQAIREVMKEKGIKDWKQAEKDPEIAKYFGSLEAEKQDKAGKVIFFDAYPLPNQHGLEMDMANNIWKWENNQPKYASNPNVFLSLKKPTFLIGLRLVNNHQDHSMLETVKQWLMQGLELGVGSQVNSGYGTLTQECQEKVPHEFFRVKFALEGQLIHGYQRFNNVQKPYKPDKKGNLKPDTTSHAEVRPIAFKSMLRYWFRAFALGVLEPKKVQEWEAKLFGGINPQTWGYLKVDIRNEKVNRKEPNYKNKESGILILSHSLNSPNNSKDRELLKKLFKNLTWLMFNLGGIGQGARRPCYSRKNRSNSRPPLYRGSTFFKSSLPDGGETIQEFKAYFQKRLIAFYKNLATLIDPFDYRNLQACGVITQSHWENVVDAHCRIIVCSGQENFDKPYALATLHDPQFKYNGKYDKNLCGTNGKPSPIWIRDFELYQVVTIFGVTADPRKSYLDKLQSDTNPENFAQIFPL